MTESLNDTGLPSLGDVDLFHKLNEADTKWVVQACQRVEVENGAYIYYQGDPANRLHVLLSGRVRLSQLTIEGQQIILRHVSPGEAFAVLAVLSEVSYPTSAQAVEDSQIAYWEKETMQQLMLQYPRIALNALQILATQTREFQDRIRELTTERVEQRIARALLRLARQTSRKVPDGILIDVTLSRQELAEMTGTTIYTVSRILSQWEGRNLIKTGREKVTIVNPHRMVMIAEDLPPQKQKPK